MIIYLFSFKHAFSINEFRVYIDIKNHIIISKNNCNEIHDIISQSTKKCKAYITQDHIIQTSEKRMILQELLNNFVRINQNEEKSRRS